MSEEAAESTAPVGIRVGAAPTIRVATKAIIIRDGRLLVTVNEGAQGRFFLCPGGGQEHGEDAHQALRRECREEIGCDVVIGDFAFLRDYIGADHEFASVDGWAHQTEAYFFCEIASGEAPRLTDAGDVHQIGIEWIELAMLADAPLWPKALATWLASPLGGRPGYLGNVN